MNMATNLPWPPGQMGCSIREPRSRDDVMGILADLRKALFDGGMPFDDFVWGMKRNPAGVLCLYMFHADCVPTSARDPWVFRTMAENPPPDEQWEVKFVKLAAVLETGTP